jgi:hypothetical protein
MTIQRKKQRIAASMDLIASSRREQVSEQRCRAENEDKKDENRSEAHASHHPRHRAVHHFAHIALLLR